MAQCLKTTQNVAFEFLDFGISPQFLSHLNWPVWFHCLTASLENWENETYVSISNHCES